MWNLKIDISQFTSGGGGSPKLMFENPSTKKLLDIQGGLDGSVIIAADHTGADSQKWNLITNGDSHIIKNPYNNKVLDLADPAGADASGLKLSDDTGATTQKWTFNDKDGFFNLKNLGVNKIVSITGNNLTISSKLPDNQRFTIKKINPLTLESFTNLTSTCFMTPDNDNNVQVKA